ncbi:MAG: amidohydrolase family protein [Myxococcota bacterium]
MHGNMGGAMANKKSSPDADLRSVIPFHPCSNGEYEPSPPDHRARRTEAMWRQLVEEKHRRAGMGRREFAQSACGVATSLFVLNQMACADGDTPNPGQADTGADGGFFDVPPEMMEDPECAEALLYDPDQFVLDVQTHVANPPLSSPWPEGSPTDRAVDYIKQIFVEGGTTVACISGVPSARTPGQGNMQARSQLKEIIGRIGGDRMRLHCNVDFRNPPTAELDYMNQITDNHDVGAWKVYPYTQQWLANQEQGLPFAEQARDLGVPVIAAHRGIAGDGDYLHPGSPRDLVDAARQVPQVQYLCYHSGWENGRREDHPYDPQATDDQTFGIDRFIRALIEFDIPRNAGNVYAELGSTWHNLRARPEEAAHALGKLLLYLGEDRILFGTDSVFNGPPQGQIAALRAFQIPARLREEFGYPEITDDIRRKILGLNAAPLYNVDPTTERCRFDDMDVENLRLSYLNDPKSVPMPHPQRYIGPQTRREFFAFVKNERRLGEHG